VVNDSRVSGTDRIRPGRLPSLSSLVGVLGGIAGIVACVIAYVQWRSAEKHAGLAHELQRKMDQRQADENYRARRAQLIADLYDVPDVCPPEQKTCPGRNECGAAERRCPHRASVRSRESALRELLEMERTRPSSRDYGCRGGPCGSKIDLRHLSLSGGSLPNVDFGGASLWKAEFAMTRLEEASFRGVYMNYVDFHGANLNKANFEHAVVQGIRATGRAQARGANFDHANLLGANFSAAHLGCLARLRGATFRHAVLTETNFSDASANCVVFQNAELGRADFSLASLSDSDFRGASARDASFREADLRGADLSTLTDVTAHQFAGACGDRKTRPPPNVSLPICTQEFLQARIERWKAQGLAVVAD
jgi:uncharacterized protein YjbI with pentapeptide repeats